MPYLNRFRSALGYTFLFVLLLLSVLAISLPTFFSDDCDASVLAREDIRDSLSTLHVPDFYLRILPLGASIVWGMGSTRGNGFRKCLRRALRESGFKVHMVGSQRNGDMTDNEVEAHPGDTIVTIQRAAAHSVKFKPNLILINAGNNDARLNDDIAHIGDRYNALLDYLYTQVPGTTIILSTLVYSTNPKILANLDPINNKIREIARQRRYERGQKLVLAEMNAPGNDFKSEKIGKSDLSPDGIHPNNEGYEKMAAVWFRAIIEATNAGFLTPPQYSANVSDAARFRRGRGGGHRGGRGRSKRLKGL